MTRITLEDQRSKRPPVVKRTNIGETFNGAILKVEQRDRLKPDDDGTMQPIVKPDGKHMQELIVTCLTLPGTTSSVGLDDEEFVPEPGTIVRLILKGKAFSEWIQAKKSLPDKSIAVGDVVTQTTEFAQVYVGRGGEKSGGEITDPAKVAEARAKGRSVGVYGPLTLREAEDGSEWTAKAVAAYRAMERVVVAEPAGDPYEGVPAAWDDNEPPPF